MIRLTACGDALDCNRKGFGLGNYSLTNLHRLPSFETDGIYGVADPSVGGRIIIGAACGWVRQSIVDMLEYKFERLALSVHPFPGACESLPFAGVSAGHAFGHHLSR